MSTVPDPMSIRRPGMIDNQDKNTVFLKPMITSPKDEEALGKIAGEAGLHSWKVATETLTNRIYDAKR